MTTDYLQAIDDIFGEVQTVWSAASQSILGYVGEIRWYGREPKALPDREKYWLRVFQRTVMERQTALGRVQNDNGRQYRTDGLLFIHLFCPIVDKAAVTEGRRLANEIKNHFRALQTTNGVLFANTYIDELPMDGDWYRFNIIAQYNYEEIG